MGLDRFGSRGSVAEAAVWPHGVIVRSPAFDEHLRLQQRVKLFTSQELVAQLAVERLTILFPSVPYAYVSDAPG